VRCGDARRHSSLLRAAAERDREEAYAYLLCGEESTTRSVVIIGLRWRPRDMELRFYWLASWSPSLYTRTRRLIRER